MIILTVYTPSFQPLADLVLPFWREWAERYGHELIALCEDKIDGQLGQLAQYHYSYYKMSRVYDVFGQEKPDAMMVVDLDILPTNMRINPASYVSTKHAITIADDVNGTNAGVFFLNGFWTTKVGLWLRTIIALRNHTTSEQHAMDFIEEAYSEEIFYYQHPCFNSIPYDEYPDYRGKHIGYEGNWMPGHPTCHLPGMVNERRIEIFKNYIPLIVR